jgi:carbohydrate kinase (thermoresistant glucokinase family)
MAIAPFPIYIVLGVSGVGKTTIGQALAEQLGLPFFDADDYHPPRNVAKMERGQALNDEDRAPWLARLAALLAEQEGQGGAVLACSALKRAYRHQLANGLQQTPHWIFLKASRELIAARMQARDAHFMPASLLDSQLATLEIPTDALEVDTSQPLADCLAYIVSRTT